MSLHDKLTETAGFSYGLVFGIVLTMVFLAAFAWVSFLLMVGEN